MIDQTKDQAGMVTISYIMATGLSLLVMVFVVASYTRAVIRDAASNATRTGVANFNLSQDTPTALNACEERFFNDLDTGLPATTRSGLSAKCSIRNGKIVLRTTGSLQNVGGVFLPIQIDEITQRDVERGTP